MVSVPVAGRSLIPSGLGHRRQVHVNEPPLDGKPHCPCGRWKAEPILGRTVTPSTSTSRLPMEYWPASHLSMDYVPAGFNGETSTPPTMLVRPLASRVTRGSNFARKDGELGGSVADPSTHPQPSHQKFCTTLSNAVPASVRSRRRCMWAAQPSIDMITSKSAKRDRRSCIVLHACSLHSLLGVCSTPPRRRSLADMAPQRGPVSGVLNGGTPTCRRSSQAGLCFRHTARSPSA